MESLKISYKGTSAEGAKQDWTLSWESHPAGANLLMKGAAFQPAGFSIGIYTTNQLKDIVAKIQGQIPNFGYLHQLYTFTRPAKFAKGQGPETSLAIHAAPHRQSQVYPYHHHYYEHRTCTVHEQGERSSWRWMGRFRCDDLCAFLIAGADIARPALPHLRKEKPIGLREALS